MSILNGIIIGIVLVLFPFTIYTIYVAYLNTFYKEERNIYLDFTLLSSLILVIKYCNSIPITLLLVNIPLLIAYLKNRSSCIIILSSIIIYYINITLNIGALFLLLEYLIYYLIYIFIRIKRINTDKFMNIFIFIKSFVISFQFILMAISDNLIIDFIYLTILILIFVFSTYFILSLMKKSNSLIEFNNIKYELEREKKLKLSLFKLTHEIKNPIAVCKGYLKMINLKDQVKAKKYIKIINDEVNRTLMIINDFSDYGKLKIEKDIVDLSLLLEEIYNTIKPLFNKKDVEIEFCSIDEEILIELDYNRIKQVLINILKNSIEAKKINEKMILTLDVKSHKDYIIIYIKDTGIGMSKDTLSKISNIFYTTKDNGTGLGVALSKEIIKLHGGTINYKSKLGVGTTVSIKLPIK